MFYNKQKIALVIALIVLGGTGLAFGLRCFTGEGCGGAGEEENSATDERSETNQTGDQNELALEPARVDFGATAPQDFPPDIPLEQGIVLDESYRLKYPRETQATVTFTSKRTLEENIALYKDYVLRGGYKVLNEASRDGIAMIYGSTERRDINVTVQKKTETSSLMSISVLNK